MNKRACSNYDIKKKTKFITNEEMIKKGGSRYFNLINQYIASVSTGKEIHRKKVLEKNIEELLNDLFSDLDNLSLELKAQKKTKKRKRNKKKKKKKKNQKKKNTHLQKMNQIH